MFEGALQGRKRQGKGKLFHANGDVYEGEWVKDKREGAGKFFIKAEDVLIEGIFRDDALLRGKLTDRFGNVFITLEDVAHSGCFVDGRLNGKVKIQYANSNQFEGCFIDGKRSGQGRMVYSNILAPADALDLQAVPGTHS